MRDNRQLVHVNLMKGNKWGFESWYLLGSSWFGIEVHPTINQGTRVWICHFCHADHKLVASKINCSGKSQEDLESPEWSKEDIEHYIQRHTVQNGFTPSFPYNLTPGWPLLLLLLHKYEVWLKFSQESPGFHMPKWPHEYFNIDQCHRQGHNHYEGNNLCTYPRYPAWIVIEKGKSENYVCHLEGEILLRLPVDRRAITAFAVQLYNQPTDVKYKTFSCPLGLPWQYSWYDPLQWLHRISQCIFAQSYQL